MRQNGGPFSCKKSSLIILKKMILCGHLTHIKSRQKSRDMTHRVGPHFADQIAHFHKTHETVLKIAL